MGGSWVTNVSRALRALMLEVYHHQGHQVAQSPVMALHLPPAARSPFWALDLQDGGYSYGGESCKDAKAALPKKFLSIWHTPEAGHEKQAESSVRRRPPRLYGGCGQA